MLSLGFQVQQRNRLETTCSQARAARGFGDPLGLLSWPFVEALHLTVEMVPVWLPCPVCGERSWVKHQGGEETLPCFNQSSGLQPALATRNLCLKLARNGLKHPRTSHSADNPLSGFMRGMSSSFRTSRSDAAPARRTGH